MKRCRRPAPPAGSPGMFERECLCPCKEKFVVASPKNKRIFFGPKCFYRYARQEIEAGRRPPDRTGVCTICGDEFPIWYAMSGSRTPPTCRKPECFKWSKHTAGRGKGVRPDIAASVKKKPLPPLAAGWEWTRKAAEAVRAGYCTQHQSAPVCKHYTGCLEPIMGDGYVFLKYFESQGTCYEYPDKYHYQNGMQL